MRIHALAIAVVLTCSTPALPMDDQTAAAEALSAYKTALINGDGRTASALMSAESHALLRAGIDRALSMEANELRGLSPIDQLVVLLLRHSVDTEHLRNMRKTDPLEYAVNARVFDSQKIANVEIYEIQVEGDEAEGYLRNAWGLQPDAAVYLRKQGSAWRIDLARYLGQFVPVAVIVDASAVDEGTDIEADIMSFTILEITGRAPDANIWNPPG